MTSLRRSGFTAATVVAVVVAALAGSVGQPATSVAVDTHGGIRDGSGFQSAALTSDAFLQGVEGPYGNGRTADDEVLLVTGLAATPSVTPLATPFRTDYSGSITRLSATRALVHTRGPDNTQRTADDHVLLLDRLGSGNVVTSIVVGGLTLSDASAPVDADRLEVGFDTHSEGAAPFTDTVVGTVTPKGITWKRPKD